MQPFGLQSKSESESATILTILKRKHCSRMPTRPLADRMCFMSGGGGGMVGPVQEGWGRELQWGPSWTNLNMSAEGGPCLVMSKASWLLVTWDLLWTDGHNWKRYLPAISLAGGKYMLNITWHEPFFTFFFNGTVEAQLISQNNLLTLGPCLFLGV